MKQCIFCMQEKEDKDFNREHVILDSLGGGGVNGILDNVCKKCNSLLGTKVDCYLANHEVIEVYRYKYKVKGKNGIPNPFKDRKTPYADTGILGTICTDKNTGDITGFCAINKVYEKDGQTLIVSPKKYHVGYVNNQLKKKGIPPLQEQKIINGSVDLGPIKTPTITSIDCPKDLLDECVIQSYPAMLKMAYEFCYISLGEGYLKDPLASDIRQFINNIDVKKQTEYYSPTSMIQKPTQKDVKDVELSIDKEGAKINVEISLFGVIRCQICMSENAERYGDFKLEKLKTDN